MTVTVVSNGAPIAAGRERRARRMPVPEDAEDAEDSEDEGEEVEQGGMERVRKLLQSVKKSMNKTFAKSPAAGILRAKVVGHRTDPPNDVKELISRYTHAQKVLMQIPAKRAEYTDGVESAVAAKGTFDALLRELGETRSTYQLAEATTAVADTLLRIQDVQSQAEQSVIEFLFTMARQERKYTATVREQVDRLENLRASLDKVLAKQKTALETGAPSSDLEKVERRKQKAASRRLAFQDQVALLRKTVPETELQADAAYCEALVEMLRQQRSSISGAALMLSELDARMQDVEALAAETLSNLRSQQVQETRKHELAIAEACGPRMVEMLSAPDFAVALAITQLCASPGDYVEEGEESLKSLLRLLDDSDLCVPLLKFSISLELPREPTEATAATVFRMPSLAGALCSVALQMTGEGYLKASLTPLVAQIASGEADFEIDPRLLADEEDLEVNIDNLCKAVQWFMDTIAQSCRDAPVLLRTLCMHVYNIAGPKRRALARRVAGALLMDAFISAAVRDPVRSGLVETMPDGKSQRVLEHVARALSRTIYDGDSEVASPSVFAAATMSDFALDLPPLPAELNAVIVDNRQRLMAADGMLDQLAGVAEMEDDDERSPEVRMHVSSQELVEETSDVLVLRQLITAHYSVLSGILHQGGFHGQVAQLEACVQGSRTIDGNETENAPGKLLPGSNQPAPVESNTWTETWKGPEDGWEEGEEELDAGMLDGERLLGEVISTPHKAAGVGAVSGGSVSNDGRSLAQRLASPHHHQSPASHRKMGTRARYPSVEVEDGDSMPDSAPERPDVHAKLPGLVHEVKQALTRSPLHSGGPEAGMTGQVAAGHVHRDGAGGGLEQTVSEDQEGEMGLLKPRRKFTKTKALSVLPPASANATRQDDPDKAPAQSDGNHASAQVDAAGVGELSGDRAEEAADLGGEDALDAKFPAEFGAGQGWELARAVGSKQPALRRTQRTVTIRDRREEDEDEDEQDGGAERASARVIAAPATRDVHETRLEEEKERAEVPTERTADVAHTDPASTGVGRLFGVGAVFKRGADGFFYVKKVVIGGPADKAGMLAGSRVVSMDNERLYSKTAEQLFKIVLGSEGTTLKLALQPPGAGVRAPEQVVMVRRAFIDENSLNATAIEPLPKSDAGLIGTAAWAPHQLVAAAPGAVSSRALPPTEGVMGNAEHIGVDKVGIGVTFKKDGNGYYVVKRVSARGGAFGSGLAIGDCVISIDGHNMHRKSSQELSRSVLGPEGTSVTLVVRSQDAITRCIEVKRLREQAADNGDVGALDAGQGEHGDWEGGATGSLGKEWDGEGQVMSLDDNEAEGTVGIGATLVRDSRGLFVVAELSGARQLSVGDIIVQVDGIQAAGKSVEAVERLIMGPVGSPIELVMAQSLGGSTRTVNMARCPHLQRPAACESEDTTQTAHAAASDGGGRRARQQIVPNARPAAAAWSEKRQASHTLGSTQVGLAVTCEDLDASLDHAVFGGHGCGLRIRSIFQDLSVGRFEKVEVGDIVLAVDGVPVAPNANDSILYGPPGSVVTLTIQKAQPDGRVLEVLLTRASALDLKERPEEEEEDKEQEEPAQISEIADSAAAAADEAAASPVTLATPLVSTISTPPSPPTAAVQPIPPPNTPAWPAQHATESAQPYGTSAIAPTSPEAGLMGGEAPEPAEARSNAASAGVSPHGEADSSETGATGGGSGSESGQAAGGAGAGAEASGAEGTGAPQLGSLGDAGEASESSKDSGSKVGEASAPSPASKKDKKKKKR